MGKIKLSDGTYRYMHFTQDEVLCNFKAMLKRIKYFSKLHSIYKKEKNENVHDLVSYAIGYLLCEISEYCSFLLKVHLAKYGYNIAELNNLTVIKNYRELVIAQYHANENLTDESLKILSIIIQRRNDIIHGIDIGFTERHELIYASINLVDYDEILKLFQFLAKYSISNVDKLPMDTIERDVLDDRIRRLNFIREAKLNENNNK